MYYVGLQWSLQMLNYLRSEFPQNQSKEYLRTHVKKSASIGAFSQLFVELRLTEYALIGSGAVVTQRCTSLYFGNGQSC